MSTTVTGTLVDARGQVWINAPIQFVFVQAFATPGPYTWSGGAFNKMSPIIRSDASGHFSIVLPANFEITPSGSYWQAIIGPNANFPAVVLNLKLLPGALDISLLFTERATFNDTQSLWIPRAYNDSEVAVPPNSGQLYYNVTSKALKYYEDGAWQPVSGSGGSVMVYPPVGVAVSGGSFWSASIDPATLARTNAVNIYTAPPVYTHNSNGSFTVSNQSGLNITSNLLGYNEIDLINSIGPTVEHGGFNFYNAANGTTVTGSLPILVRIGHQVFQVYTTAQFHGQTVFEGPVSSIEAISTAKNLVSTGIGAIPPSATSIDYYAAGNVSRFIASGSTSAPGGISFAGLDVTGTNYWEYMRLHGETPIPYVQIIADLSVEPYGTAVGKVTAAGGFITPVSYQANRADGTLSASFDAPSSSLPNGRISVWNKGSNNRGGLQIDGLNSDFSKTITWLTMYEDAGGLVANFPSTGLHVGGPGLEVGGLTGYVRAGYSATSNPPSDPGSGTLRTRLVLAVNGQTSKAYPGEFKFETFSTTDVDALKDTLAITHYSAGPLANSPQIWSLSRSGVMRLYDSASTGKLVTSYNSGYTASFHDSYGVNASNYGSHRFRCMNVDGSGGIEVLTVTPDYSGTVSVAGALKTFNGLAVKGVLATIPFEPSQLRLLQDGGVSSYIDCTGPDTATFGQLIIRVMHSDSSGVVEVCRASYGSFAVTGNLSATGAKTFVMDHPFDDSKQLIHSCLEGPENALFYRGEVVTQGGVAEVTLPHYFEALTFTEDRSVMLTLIVDEAAPIFGGQVAAGRIKNGKFKVFSTDATATIAWEVKAVRKLGVDRLKVERLKTESL